MSNPWIHGLVAAMATIVCACSARMHSTPPAGPTDKTTKPAEASGRIGPEGGIITLTSGAARGGQIVIPPGALSAAVTITMSAMNATDAAMGLPSGAVSAGPVVNFGPEGLTFARPVTVTLPATRQANGMHTRPQHGGAWSKVVESHFDAARSIVVGQLSHFSLAGSTYTPPPSNIIGGQDAPPGQYAATGYLLRQNDPTYPRLFNCLEECTVTLIHDPADALGTPSNVALTAAHCVYGLSPGSPLAVGFGEICEGQGTNAKAWVPCPVPITEGGDTRTYRSTYPVAQILPKKAIDPSNIPEAEVVSDIAILVLAMDVPGIPPADLPTATDDSVFTNPNNQCNFVTLGYGRTTQTDMLSSARKLAYLCFESYQNGHILLTNGGGGTPCNGDSGGPLFLANTNTILGIDSSGPFATGGPCGMTTNYVSVYANYNWITSQLAWKHSFTCQ